MPSVKSTAFLPESVPRSKVLFESFGRFSVASDDVSIVVAPIDDSQTRVSFFLSATEHNVAGFGALAQSKEGSHVCANVCIHHDARIELLVPFRAACGDVNARRGHDRPIKRLASTCLSENHCALRRCTATDMDCDVCAWT